MSNKSYSEQSDEKSHFDKVKNQPYHTLYTRDHFTALISHLWISEQVSLSIALQSPKDRRLGPHLVPLTRILSLSPKKYFGRRKKINKGLITQEGDAEPWVLAFKISTLPQSLPMSMFRDLHTLSLRGYPFEFPAGVHHLGCIRNLDLSGSKHLTDVRGLGNVYNLNLSGCRSIHQFPLMCNHRLTISDVHISDVRPLRGVHTLIMENNSKLEDARPLRNVHTLVLSKCINLIHVDGYRTIFLDLSNSINAMLNSSLRKVKCLSLSGFYLHSEDLSVLEDIETLDLSHTTGPSKLPPLPQLKKVIISGNSELYIPSGVDVEFSRYLPYNSSSTERFLNEVSKISCHRSSHSQ